MWGLSTIQAQLPLNAIQSAMRSATEGNVVAVKLRICNVKQYDHSLATRKKTLVGQQYE